VPSSNPSSSNPSTSVKPAAVGSKSGGARKPAAVGSKRGRGVTETAEIQQQQQQFSNSDPPGSASGPFRSQDPAASTSGAISLPTPHRRPRQISAGLLAAAAAAGGAEARAAQTVMEVSMQSTLACVPPTCSELSTACVHTQPATSTPGYVQCSCRHAVAGMTQQHASRWSCCTARWHVCADCYKLMWLHTCRIHVLCCAVCRPKSVVSLCRCRTRLHTP
jgi:hypothetical protein